MRRLSYPLMPPPRPARQPADALIKLNAWSDQAKAAFDQFIEEIDGLERPDIFFVQVAYGFAPEPITPKHFSKRGPYGNPEGTKQQLDEAVERGWLEAAGDAQYILTPKGKKGVKKLFALAEKTFGSFEPLPHADMKRIVELLTRVVDKASELAETLTYRNYDEASYAVVLDDLVSRGWAAQENGKYVISENSPYCMVSIRRSCPRRANRHRPFFLRRPRPGNVVHRSPSVGFSSMYRPFFTDRATRRRQANPNQVSYHLNSSRKRQVRRGGSQMKRLLTIVCTVLMLLTSLNVQPAHADESGTYTVQPGDTLLGIALRFGVNVSQLADANGVEWNSWVYVGQRLRIPGAQAPDVSAEPEPEPEPVDLGPDPLLPDPLPELPLLPQAHPGDVLPYSYARVTQTNVPVYGQPSDATQGRQPKRRLGAGFLWVSLSGQTRYDGIDYYQINSDEYVAAEAMSVYSPSAFQGVALARGPERPFAWILKPVQPQITPRGELNPAAPTYQRYHLVQIFATEHLGSQVWYLIGPHQWINQIYVGKVDVSPRPDGVEPDAKWVEVDLFEQTLAAYEGDRLVYATLVSSGLRGWDTPTGLKRVWLRVDIAKMSGGYGRPDYYFLEDVPWTLYFNRSVALHTAYWHDGFGYKRSHGCVNLPPIDAKWLFEWAPDDLWVWVHSG